MTNIDALEWFKERRDGMPVMPMSAERKMFSLAISALEKQEADRWHSVAIEGNPKESGVYNCTCSNGTPVKRVTTIKYFKRTNEWAMTGRRTFWKVIAWRPLPAPYKDDTDKTEEKS